MSKIFGLILGMQEELIQELCFEKCGKIIVGGLTDDILGAMCPCREEKCPYEEKRLKYGMAGSENDEVWIRKLKGRDDEG